MQQIMENVVLGSIERAIEMHPCVRGSLAQIHRNDFRAGVEEIADENHSYAIRLPDVESPGIAHFQQSPLAFMKHGILGYRENLPENVDAKGIRGPFCLGSQR